MSARSAILLILLLAQPAIAQSLPRHGIAPEPLPVIRAGLLLKGENPGSYRPTDPPPEESSCAFCPTMIDLPGGAFRMGSISGAGDPSELPVTEITLLPFQMSQSEITVGEFRRFMDASGYAISPGCFVWTAEGRMRFRDDADWSAPGYEVSDDMPVSCINWDDAARYVEWLNSVEGGGGFRLPSEAEFEYAARAGSESDYFWGDDPALACDHVNGADAGSRFRWRNTACEDMGSEVVSVSAYPPNGLGLSNMIGNVWEWTADCWFASHEGASPQGAPRAKEPCNGRVLRGASWDDPPENLRSSYRVSIPSTRRQANIGFRVAR
jgi:formylglycine-generating enzyme required for sulfatase activity